MIGGERQARFPGRPLPHQWWSAVLNVLPLLLLIYPSTGELWQQDFEPRAKPLNSKSPGLTAGQIPACSDFKEGTEYVTQVHAVEGFSAIFHCPCASPSCDRHGWQVNGATPNSDFIKNSTHLTFPNVTRAYLGWCVTCVRTGSGSYLLYNITEVEALEHLHFNNSDLAEPKKCSENESRKFCTLHIVNPIINGSNNFSVECPVRGYPPYQSLSWDLSHWEQLRPCVSFSNDNRTITFRFAKEFNILSHVYLHCTARNALDILTGIRAVDPSSGLNSHVGGLFDEPLQMQTAGTVELNEFGNASFVCASKGWSEYNEYRVCRVDYTVLTVVERCTASGLSASSTCCTVSYYYERSGNCSELTTQTLLVEQETFSVLNVTTAVPGHYQCQVYNENMGGYQSIGDPILVVLPQPPSEEACPSTPYMYLFFGSVGVIFMLLGGLVVVVGVFYCRGRRKRWSTSQSVEGQHLLRRHSTRSSISSSVGEHGRTTVIMEQRLHGEGSRRLEVGQSPMVSNLLPAREGAPLTNGAISLQTIDSLDDCSSNPFSSSQSSYVHFDDALETVFEELQPEGNDEPRTSSLACATSTTVRLQPVMHPQDPCNQAGTPQPPVSLELLVEYIPQMAPQWYVLAVALGVGMQAAIIEDSIGRTDKKCTEALAAWINSGLDVTWTRLIQALRKQNLGAVASRIESRLRATSRPVQCHCNGGTT